MNVAGLISPCQFLESLLPVQTLNPFSPGHQRCEGVLLGLVYHSCKRQAHRNPGDFSWKRELRHRTCHPLQQIFNMRGESPRFIKPSNLKRFQLNLRGTSDPRHCWIHMDFPSWPRRREQHSRALLLSAWPVPVFPRCAGLRNYAFPGVPFSVRS